jgi:hypothetical protein
MRSMTRSICIAAGSAVVCAAVAIGPLLAQGRGGGGAPKPTVNHKVRQDRPIQLGTSGGNATDIANGYCCSGTLGSLVQGRGRLYILSNSHVFAHDVSGPNVAEIGDPVNQAGLIDSQCVASAADTVANLSSLSSIAQGGVSAVDAAIAEVVPGTVSVDGAILGIGTISSTPLDPALGVRVKKSGRTTGLTTSRIDAVNAMIQVGYSTECAGASYSSTFVGQIVVANRGSKFLAGGDSGSLMVEDVATNPRPIGLLYAGSSTVGIANPIGDVLAHLNVEMVGAPGSVAAALPEGASEQETSRAVAAQVRHAARLMSVPTAIGHAVGIGGNGVAIKVYVEEMTDRARQGAPAALDGVPVVVEAIGRVMAIGSMAGACRPAR